MSNIHPFNRAKEFPNYFEIMLKSVPEGERSVFVKKIQKLIEQNISAIVKRLKLYYANDQGELSTDDYFNELVKRMEHALKESPAKNDYNLEVYLSGGVVRTLLGYVYRQLHTNIQEVFEDEFEAAKTSTDKDEMFPDVHQALIKIRKSLPQEGSMVRVRFQSELGKNPLNRKAMNQKTIPRMLQSLIVKKTSASKSSTSAI